MPYPLEGMVCLVTRTHTYTGRKAYLVSAPAGFVKSQFLGLSPVPILC